MAAATAEEEEGSATVTGDEGACQLPRALGHGCAGLREAKEKKRLDSGKKTGKKLFFFRANHSGTVLLYIPRFHFVYLGGKDVVAGVFLLSFLGRQSVVCPLRLWWVCA